MCVCVCVCVYDEFILADENVEWHSIFVASQLITDEANME